MPCCKNKWCKQKTKTTANFRRRFFCCGCCGAQCSCSSCSVWCAVCWRGNIFSLLLQLVALLHAWRVAGQCCGRLSCRLRLVVWPMLFAWWLRFAKVLAFVCLLCAQQSKLAVVSTAVVSVAFLVLFGLSCMHSVWLGNAAAER